MVRTVLTERDKIELKAVALEIFEIRKVVDRLAETLANLSDKELLKFLNASQDDLKEKQVDKYKETLEKQLDNVEKEFRL